MSIFSLLSNDNCAIMVDPPKEGKTPYHPEREIVVRSVGSVGCDLSRKLDKIVEDLHECDLDVSPSELIVRNVSEYLLLKTYRDDLLETAKQAARDKLKPCVKS